MRAACQYCKIIINFFDHESMHGVIGIKFAKMKKICKKKIYIIISLKYTQYGRGDEYLYSTKSDEQRARQM